MYASGVFDLVAARNSSLQMLLKTFTISSFKINLLLDTLPKYLRAAFAEASQLSHVINPR